MAPRSFVPFDLATNEFIIAKAIELHSRKRRLPKKLISEIKKRKLIDQLPEEIREAYFGNGNGINGKNGIDLPMLYAKLGMIREARELKWRMEMFSNFKFVVDGYYRGRPAMILELTVEYVKIMIEGGDIISIPLHLFEKYFVPAR